MDRVNMLLVIVQPEMEKDYTALLWENGLSSVFSTPCRGTAGQQILNLLGLERSDKTLLYAVAPRWRANRLLTQMVSALGINVPGGGIAVSVPVGSIGGTRGMKYLMDIPNGEAGETGMEKKREFPYDLIIAIAQRDSAERVMEAARTAGAHGGTIVHAKGTGTEYAQKFFGMTIAAEKELVLIVARHERKDPIMRAIMEHAGAKTEARAIVFSVPVESVAGLSGLQEFAQDSAN